MVINVEGWKSKGERGPLAQFAPHIDRSPVCLAGVLNQRQSQAGSTVFPGTGVVHPIEPFENTLLAATAIAMTSVSTSRTRRAETTTRAFGSE